MFDLRPGIYSDERQRHQPTILTVIELDPEVTLQKITDECKRLNVKRDNTRIEEKIFLESKRQNKKRKRLSVMPAGVSFKKELFL